MRIETEEWPVHLKSACRDRCAEMGEPACWQVDEWINPRDPDRGLVCEDCRAECFALAESE